MALSPSHDLQQTPRESCPSWHPAPPDAEHQAKNTLDREEPGAAPEGADRPITSSLANLGGEFFTDDNLIAAASMYVALPTLIVYFALQR
jgi:hypothetical protein